MGCREAVNMNVGMYDESTHLVVIFHETGERLQVRNLGNAKMISSALGAAVANPAMLLLSLRRSSTLDLS